MKVEATVFWYERVLVGNKESKVCWALVGSMHISSFLLIA